MKVETQTLKLLHDMAAEIESGFMSLDPKAWCIELIADNARKLLTRYEKLRKRLAKER